MLKECLIATIWLGILCRRHPHLPSCCRVDELLRSANVNGVRLIVPLVCPDHKLILLLDVRLGGLRLSTNIRILSLVAIILICHKDLIGLELLALCLFLLSRINRHTLLESSLIASSLSVHLWAIIMITYPLDGSIIWISEIDKPAVGPRLLLWNGFTSRKLWLLLRWVATDTFFISMRGLALLVKIIILMNRHGCPIRLFIQFLHLRLIGCILLLGWTLR